MATPQYATVIVQSKQSGKSKPFRIYCSDAAGAATWPDGLSAVTFPMDAKVVDIIFAATLATTPTLTLYVGGQPYTILNTATMTAATIVRPLMQAPIDIPSGAAFAIVQS
jgi:hypothetical protein